MTVEAIADVRRRIEHHRVALQGVAQDLKSSHAHRDEDAEAARDLQLAICSLARANQQLGPREHVEERVPNPLYQPEVPAPSATA